MLTDRNCLREEQWHGKYQAGENVRLPPMQQWERPEEERRDGETKVKEDIAQNGVVREIGDVILDRWHQAGVYSHEDTNEGSADTSNSRDKSLASIRPVTSNRLSTMRTCQAKGLVATETDMGPATQAESRSLNVTIGGLAFLEFNVFAGGSHWGSVCLPKTAVGFTLLVVGCLNEVVLGREVNNFVARNSVKAPCISI